MEVPRFSTGIIRVFLGEVGQRPRFAADDCRQIVKNLVRFHSVGLFTDSPQPGLLTNLFRARPNRPRRDLNPCRSGPAGYC
jgi:hypothetical protein